MRFWPRSDASTSRKTPAGASGAADEVPTELARRESRLAGIREAKNTEPERARLKLNVVVLSGLGRIPARVDRRPSLVGKLRRDQAQLRREPALHESPGIWRIALFASFANQSRVGGVKADSQDAAAIPRSLLQDSPSTQFLRSTKVAGSWWKPFAKRRASRRLVQSTNGPPR